MVERKLCLENISMDHNNKTRVCLRLLQTCPSHLQHRTQTRGASKVELQPGLGWDWFHPAPEQRQLHSHCQWGPVRAWALLPHLHRAGSGKPRHRRREQPSLTLNTSSRHQLEAFMLTALGDRKHRDTLLTIHGTQGIGSEINSSSIFVTVPEKWADNYLYRGKASC